MNRIIKYGLLLCLGIFAMGCFKKSFSVVDLPVDYNPADTTGAPARTDVTRKVLLIGIDGCRADALQAADAPNIKVLLEHAVYSFDAQTMTPTLSGPGWSSMLTGVWSSKHGVTDNSFVGSHFEQYPTLFKYMDRLSEGKQTSISDVSWNPINQFIATDATEKVNLSENDVAVRDAAIKQLENGDPALLFLHFDQVDAAGHSYGFSQSVPEYMDAIHQVDALVGGVLTALKARASFAKEDWLIVLSTDHGGTGTSHGGNSDAEKNIFTIFYNSHFVAKNVVPPPTVLKAVKLTNTGSGSYANLMDYYNLDSFPKLTFQFEIKTSQLSSDIPFFTNKDWGSGGNKGFVFNVRSQSWKINIADGAQRLDVNATDVPNLNDNLWHTLTVTFNRAGDVTMYQDGIKCGSTNMSGLTTIMPVSDVKLAINEDITSDYGRTNFSVANVKIWKDVLSPEYLATPNCDTAIASDDPYKTSLLSWWKCSDGDGNKFKDYMGTGFDFQLYGDPTWGVQTTDFCNNALPPSVPVMVDIMPTILSWLGYSVDYSGWHLDGVSWLPLNGQVGDN